MLDIFSGFPHFSGFPGVAFIYHLTNPSILWSWAKNLVALALAEDVRVLIERGADELVLLPQVGGEEAVGVGDGREGGLEGVLKGLGATGRGRVGVVDTSELQQTLDGGGGDNAGTAGSGDELVVVLVSAVLPVGIAIFEI